MDVIGIFHGHKPSGRIMAVGSTQPLTEMSTRIIYWRDNGGLHVPIVLKSGNLKLLQTIQGPSTTVEELIYLRSIFSLTLVAIRSKKSFCGRLSFGIAGSNPAEGMDFCILCFLCE
jgi:hypothetical protein